MGTDPLREVWKKDPRYRFEAYHFLLEALDRVAKSQEASLAKSGGNKHVTGQELLEGMRQHATHLFGPLAAQVWRTWGIENTLDWGRIVFNLVESELLRRQDSDTIDDFRDGYDFDEVFIRSYELRLPHELGLRPTDPPEGDGGLA
ncbi:MAG: Minf_1886 family protein [Planctomycetota bacterium]